MSDADARRHAVDPARSFIVQAPAGSGKTELLIQRMLALLATVDEPEEILALTFTRKAAGEMRLRVIEALRRSQEAEPEQPHEQQTWRLAQAALARSTARSWNLLAHPARLTLITIDAFALGLARQMPLASGLGDAPGAVDDAQALYLEAAEQTMTAVRSGRFPDAVGQALDALLLRADHRTGQVLGMLAQMLACREQWLGLFCRHADEAGLREEINTNLRRLAEDRMQHAAALFAPQQRQRLLPLLRFAAANLQRDDPAHPAGALAGLTAWPAAETAALPAWQAMATLLLRADGHFYQRVNARQGFPADSQFRAEKVAFTELLTELAAQPGLAEALQDVRSLPASLELDEDAWRFLQGLGLILRLAAAELNTLMMTRGQMDFTEIALRALQALGEPAGASDLLLKLDRRIRHVLVDEFQDTSRLQIALLQRLCAGWEPGDGRTLFVVGDPMQSIYRFRNAEVGLFLRTAAGEIAGLPALALLRLRRNFRSGAPIVDWANRAFAGLFPDAAGEDATAGAVAYHASEPAPGRQGEVVVHWMAGRDDAAEADLVVELVQKAMAAGRRTGILARSRSHLAAIMHALHAAGIAYRAVDILPLAERPEVRDLRALTRALLHPLDRESWAALLRAPFCGLAMPDLHALLAGDPRPVAEILGDSMRLAELSADGRGRVARLCEALQPSLALAGRAPVRRLVESAWLRLAAPAALSTAQCEAAGQFLDVLEANAAGGGVDFSALDRALAALRAAPDASDEAGRVELVTMHGAKGLEWDVVILPGLGRSPRHESPALLVWTDAPLADGEALLMAARPAVDGSDALHALVRDIEKRKNRFEVDRLLYVACTRAREELHLIGHVEERKAGMEPAGNALFQRLWQGAGACHGARIEEFGTGVGRADAAPVWRRLRHPVAPRIEVAESPAEALPEFAWAGPAAAPVGNAVHAALQQVADRGVEDWRDSDTEDMLVQMRRLLLAEGLCGALLDDALRRAEAGLRQALNSTRGRWILSGRHADAHNEWALSTCADGRICHHVIDRSFVDDEVRWIIDYKTASHEGGDIEAFLDTERQRHMPQLLRYAEVVCRLESRPVRLGLYFPMLDAWREFDAG